MELPARSLLLSHAELVPPPTSGCEPIHYAEDEPFYEAARGESDAESDDDA